MLCHVRSHLLWEAESHILRLPSFPLRLVHPKGSSCFALPPRLPVAEHCTQEVEAMTFSYKGSTCKQRPSRLTKRACLKQFRCRGPIASNKLKSTPRVNSVCWSKCWILARLAKRAHRPVISCTMKNLRPTTSGPWPCQRHSLLCRKSRRPKHVSQHQDTSEDVLQRCSRSASRRKGGT